MAEEDLQSVKCINKSWLEIGRSIYRLLKGDDGRLVKEHRHLLIRGQGEGVMALDRLLLLSCHPLPHLLGVQEAQGASDPCLLHAWV